MGKKYGQVKDGEEVAPQMKGYKMACCDCGLVHRLDFEVRRVIAQKSKGVFTAVKPRNAKDLRVILRAYRDNRATAAKRRKSQ